VAAQPIQFHGKYRQRLVAFIDILGFSERIKATKGKANEVAKIADCLKEHVRGDEEERRAIYGGRWTDDGHDDFEYGLLAEQTAAADFRQSTFSDNIVMSVEPVDEGLSHLASQCSHMIVQLMKQGLYCRGGLALGDLLHEPTDNVVFGPAMIEAYDIERTIAGFPRVVLSGDVVDLLIGDLGEEPRSLLEVQKPARRFIWCEDGPCILNPFFALQSLLFHDLDAMIQEADKVSLDRILRIFQSDGIEMRNHLMVELRKAAHKPEYFRKLKWLASHFNHELATRPVLGKPFVEQVDFRELFSGSGA
jgi:hypothetical protein